MTRAECWARFARPVCSIGPIAALAALAGAAWGTQVPAARHPAVPVSPDHRPATERGKTTGAAGNRPDRRVREATGLVARQANGRLMLEIPRGLLGRDIIAIARVANVSSLMSGDWKCGDLVGTLGMHRFRWREQNHAVLLEWREAQGTYAAGPQFPMIRGGVDGAILIDVTSAYVTTFSLGPVAPTVSLVEACPPQSAIRFVHTFADHVEFEVDHRIAGRVVTMHWSLLPAPAKPMMARFADRRVPYQSIPAPTNALEGAGSAALPHQIIPRYRLEKRHPGAAVSDVVKPIVFYIDPATPKRFVPWIKRGVEAWQPSFEAIGFRNAIVAREAPSRSADPTWSLLDAAHNAVVWVDKATYEGGSGWNNEVVDSLSGEILTNRVTLGAGLEHLLQRVGFALLGGVPDVELPFPDSLIGQLMAMVTTHETGHALGLDHNMRASSAYPTDSAHSATFVRRMGYSASVMDYAYFNYLAQPEDGIPLSQRFSHIGPYDAFALGWGYRPIPDAKTPADELPTLELWRKAQDTARYLRASVPEYFFDPGLAGSDIGSDMIKMSQLGIRNFARAGARLVALRTAILADAAAGTGTGRKSDDAKRRTPALDLAMISAYQDQVLHQWGEILGQTAAMVGGAVPKVPHSRDASSQEFEPIDSARQVAALRFVLDHAYRGQDDLVQQQFASLARPIRDAVLVMLLDSLPNGWTAMRWHSDRELLLRNLLDPARLARIAEQGVGVLPVFCTELDRLRREVTAAIERAEQTNTPYVFPKAEIDAVVTSDDGFCRTHGWVPTP